MCPVLENAKRDEARYDNNMQNIPSESNNLATVKPERLRSMMQGMVREVDLRSAVYPLKDRETLKPIIPDEKNQ